MSRPHAHRTALGATRLWKVDYNHYRPHGSLGYLTPVAFAALTNPYHKPWYRKSEPAKGERDAVSGVLRLAPIIALWTLEILPATNGALRSFTARSMPIFEAVSELGCAMLYWVASTHVSTKWWRWAFRACAFTHLGLASAVGVPLFAEGAGKVLWLSTAGLFGVQLLVTSAAALSNVRRQPWSHWIGALLPFWNALVLLGFAILYVFIHDLD